MEVLDRCEKICYATESEQPWKERDGEMGLEDKMKTFKAAVMQSKDLVFEVAGVSGKMKTADRIQQPSVHNAWGACTCGASKTGG